MSDGYVLNGGLKGKFKSFAKHLYYRWIKRELDGKLRSRFIDDFFSSEAEYERYAAEFNRGPVANVRNKALHEYRQMTGKNSLADIGLDVARDYYAVTRKLEPSTIVETGVCNGVSTLCILLALEQNGGVSYTPSTIRSGPMSPLPSSARKRSKTTAARPFRATRIQAGLSRKNYALGGNWFSGRASGSFHRSSLT